MSLLDEWPAMSGQTADQSGHDILPGPMPEIPMDSRPTMLVAGSKDSGEAIVRWGERAGLHCLGRIRLSEAMDRLARTSEIDLLLVDLRGLDIAKALDRATARALSARHGLAQARLAVIVDMEGLDCAMAMLDAPGAEFLCEPVDSDIVSLLVMAGLRAPTVHQILLDDASRDGQAARLEQLSEEVRRVAEMIERMTAGGGLPAGGHRTMMDRRGAYQGMRGDEGSAPTRLFEPRDRHRASEPAAGGWAPTHAEVRAIIRARRMRDQYLPADLFADPAWDMMLDLLAARIAGQCVSVSSLCIAAAVPPTTALRWIRQLTDRAVFARIDDPADGRRVFIELTETAAQAVLGWVQAVRRNGGVLCGN